MTVTIERACADERTHLDHPPHDWATSNPYAGRGEWWCPGWPRQPRPLADVVSEAPCRGEVTVGSSRFVCARSEHYSEPGGYGGTGHTWVTPGAGVPDSTP